jgi:hypothetical protein
MAEIEPVSREGLVVCACRGREYNARDAIDAAFFRGELESIWKDFLCKINAEERAKELDLELDGNAIEEMAELFRYEHDLITAEETERWLEQRGLTLENFSDYLASQYWLSAVENVSPEDVDFVLASAEMRELFTVDSIFAGELDLFTKQLMWRLAAFAAKEGCEVDANEIATERQRFMDRLKIKRSKLKRWLDQINRDEGWLEEMLAMEAAYRRMSESVLSLEARTKQLAMLRMPLTRFEAEVIEVESVDAAREALLCIREDGMSMEEFATEARYPYRRISFRHEEIPAHFQQTFWSINAGELLEPVHRGEGFELYRVTQKTEPDLTDPVVQERVDERLLEQHFSHLARDHVKARLQEAVG